MYYPAGPSKDDGVFAVRWKQYKAHFILKGYADSIASSLGSLFTGSLNLLVAVVL